jgi:Fe(3+) dicitrate transport protein
LGLCAVPLVAAAQEQSPTQSPSRSNDVFVVDIPGDDAGPEESEKTEVSKESKEFKKSASSDEAGDKVAQEMSIVEVEVIGERPEDIESVPGSAAVVTEEELRRRIPLNTGEALQMVPGVFVQTEDGMGLRQNIGIRGLNPNRSRKVLVLEDGVPISLAPYGEPEMYYTPPIERMERIEVVKGSGSILFGPQTIGGVINYITPDPPSDFRVEAEGRGGTYGYATGHVTVGDTHNDFGYLVSALHQRFGGPRSLNLVRSDLFAKFQVKPTPTQSLSLKLDFYDEQSNSTYLGLTTPQYQTDPSFQFAINDEFNIRRFAAALTHVALVGDSTLLETRVYGHNIQRYWRRQDFDRRDKGVDYERVIDGQGRNITGASEYPTDGSAIFFRDSTGNRNREFVVAGIEPRVTVKYELGPVDNELQTGVRFHYEGTHERRINGEHATSSTGTINVDEERFGYAVALYALNRFMFLDKRLQISPGVRVESLWTEQQVHRFPVTQPDGTRAPQDLDPPIEGDNHHLAILPGVGVSYQILEPLTFFAGVHRGWAPPRTKDAVTTTGATLTLEAEHSWNYELGGRVRYDDWLRAELTGFWLDFSNQVIAPNEAGGVVASNIVNGGASTHLGFESALSIDAGGAAGWGFGLPLMVNYTFVHAEFGEGWSGALTGQTLPYAPRHLLSAHVGFIHPVGLSLQFGGNYIGEQYADKVETIEPSIDGLRGLIDARLVLDAKASYTYEPLDLSVFVAGKNLLDEQYISSRSPRGIQPGLQRHVFGGIRYIY